MRTLAAMISVGDREHLNGPSFRRLAAWATRHGYESRLLRDPLLPPDVHPAFNKLLVPDACPGFTRYVICDDDLLLSARAPALPELPLGYVGVAPDAVQAATNDSRIGWTANTGFIIAPSSATPLLTAALTVGKTPTIWGQADQGPLNLVLWAAGRIHRLDQRWNHQPVVQHYTERNEGGLWQFRRRYRVAFYASLVLGWPPAPRRLLRAAYGVHLTRAPYPSFFDRLVP